MLDFNRIKLCKLFLFAMFLAIGTTSCDDGNSTYYDPNSAANEYQQIFEGMKGEYAGNYTSPLGNSVSLKYNIDSKANVNLSSFPMENVLYKLCGGDYQYAKLSGEALSISCPIDSVGYSSGYMTFKTKNDLEHNVLNFAYTFQNVEHKGMLYVTVMGVYNPQARLITTNFVVTDLIVDGKDLTSAYCPINNMVEAVRQQ